MIETNSKRKGDTLIISKEEKESEDQIEVQMKTNLKDSLVYWMAEVFYKLKYRKETYILSVYLLDKTIWSISRGLKDSHLLSIGCIILAVKYHEVDKLKIHDVIEYIGHKTYSKNEILSVEMKILKFLKFKIPIKLN